MPERSTLSMRAYSARSGGTGHPRTGPSSRTCGAAPGFVWRGDPAKHRPKASSQEPGGGVLEEHEEPVAIGVEREEERALLAGGGVHVLHHGAGLVEHSPA